MPALSYLLVQQPQKCFEIQKQDLVIQTKAPPLCFSKQGIPIIVKHTKHKLIPLISNIAKGEKENKKELS